MSILIHIADRRDSNSILKNGIKIGKWRKGVFFMPVTQDFFGSHQWIRELKRRGIRTYVGVTFKLKHNELVWFGKYNEEHEQITLGQAINKFLSAEDRLGYEFLIERKILSTEIHKIRSIPQGVGWRYSPGSHQRPLKCACPMCISSGDINARKKINKIEPQEPTIAYEKIIANLKNEFDEYEVDNLFSIIRQRKRRADPEELRFIIDRDIAANIQSLAISLSSYKHRNAAKMLIELCEYPDDEVREFSAESLIDINAQEGVKVLERFKDDPLILNILSEQKKCW